MLLTVDADDPSAWPLRHRYGAAGRTIILAGSDGSAPSDLPRGSPGSLAVALARVAELMDRNEDTLILYTTSHGAPFPRRSDRRAWLELELKQVNEPVVSVGWRPNMMASSVGGALGAPLAHAGDHLYE